MIFANKKIAYTRRLSCACDFIFSKFNLLILCDIWNDTKKFTKRFHFLKKCIFSHLQSVKSKFHEAICAEGMSKKYEKLGHL